MNGNQIDLAACREAERQLREAREKCVPPECYWEFCHGSISNRWEGKSGAGTIMWANERSIYGREGLYPNLHFVVAAHNLAPDRLIAWLIGEVERMTAERAVMGAQLARIHAKIDEIFGKPNIPIPTLEAKP